MHPTIAEDISAVQIFLGTTKNHIAFHLQFFRISLNDARPCPHCASHFLFTSAQLHSCNSLSCRMLHHLPDFVNLLSACTTYEAQFRDEQNGLVQIEPAVTRGKVCDISEFSRLPCGVILMAVHLYRATLSKDFAKKQKKVPAPLRPASKKRRENPTLQSFDRASL